MSKTGISNTALLVGGFGLVRYFSHAVPVSKLSEMQHMLPSMLNLCCALRIVRSDFSSSFLCISYLSIVPVWNAVSPTIKQLCCSSVDEYREKVSVKCTHCAHEVTATSSSFFFSLLFFFGWWWDLFEFWCTEGKWRPCRIQKTGEWRCCMDASARPSVCPSSSISTSFQENTGSFSSSIGELGRRIFLPPPSNCNAKLLWLEWGDQVEENIPLDSENELNSWQLPCAACESQQFVVL